MRFFEIGLSVTKRKGASLLALGVMGALAFALVLVSCGDKVDEPEADKDILSFSFLAADNPSLVDDCPATVGDAEVLAEVSHGAVLSALIPTITVSDGASISPASGTAVDFSLGASYTVTGSDGSTKVYSVSLSDMGTVNLQISFKNTSTGERIPMDMVGWNDQRSEAPEGSVSIAVPKSHGKVMGSLWYSQTGSSEYSVLRSVDLSGDASIEIEKTLYATGTTHRIFFNLFVHNSASSDEQSPIAYDFSSYPWIEVSVQNQDGANYYGNLYHWSENTWYLDTPSFGAKCTVYVTVKDNGSGQIMTFSEAGYKQYGRLYTDVDLSVDEASLDVLEPIDSELSQIGISIEGLSTDVGSWATRGSFEGGYWMDAPTWSLINDNGYFKLFAVTVQDAAGTVMVDKNILSLKGFWSLSATFEEDAGNKSVELETLPGSLQTSNTFNLSLSEAPSSYCQTPTLSDGYISIAAVDGAARYAFFAYSEDKVTYRVESTLPSVFLGQDVEAADYLSMDAYAYYPLDPYAVEGYRYYQLAVTSKVLVGSSR